MIQHREAAIGRWFQMWLEKTDLGIGELFAPDAVYLESWGPEYHGADRIAHWFREWNIRGTVLRWDIRQFFHREDQTVVEWSFRCAMEGEAPSGFEGMSLIRWTPQGRIAFLQEFGCNQDRYDPYRDGPVPKFRDEKAMWF